MNSIPTLGSKPETPEPAARKTPLDNAEKFDGIHMTHMGKFLKGKNPKPRAAYDYIRAYGQFDDPDKSEYSPPYKYESMLARGILYSWLHEELSNIDTKKLSDNAAGKIGAILSGFKNKDPRPGYMKLMEELSMEMQEWYTSSITRDRTHPIELADPKKYSTFLETIPKTSPLGAILIKV